MAKRKDQTFNRPLEALGRLAKAQKRLRDLPKPPEPVAPTPPAPPVTTSQGPLAPPPSAPDPSAARTSDLSGYSSDDRTAFHQAFAGVESLDSKGQSRRGPDRRALARAVAARAKAVEDDARARLDALVGGGVHFDITRHSDGGIEGKRRGTPDRTARMLASGQLPPTATLDLHGRRQDEVSAEVRRFVRESHKAGRYDLCIIHGKGHNSEGGRGVLRGALVKALTDGGAAPLVDAFATAPRRHGGEGALLVRLRLR